MIRDDFEKRRISRVLLAHLYEKYNPAVDAYTFVHDAESLFPTLNCGLASVYVQYCLGGRIIQGSYAKNNHTFLFLPTNDIVDITADQYGGPRVYVGPLVTPWTM